MVDYDNRKAAEQNHGDAQLTARAKRCAGQTGLRRQAPRAHSTPFLALRQAIQPPGNPQHNSRDWAIPLATTPTMGSVPV